MAFGPNSTNPRERRAYAHTLRDKAIISGQPDDKIAALEAANSAANTNKGEGLGMNVFSAFRNRAPLTTSGLLQPENLADTSNGRSTSWTGPEFARRYEAVTEMIGTTGVKLTKLHTDEDYMRAANLIADSRKEFSRGFTSRHYGDNDLPNAEQLVKYGMSEGNMTLVENDYTVPGSLFAARAVQVLASRPIPHSPTSIKGNVIIL